jgi:hypothetical protein
MLDIKSGVLLLGVITTLALVSTSFNDLKSEMSLNKTQKEHMKTQMEHMKTKIELLEEFHSNTQETLELETSNRLR